MVNVLVLDYPVPELSTIILFFTGLITLIGYVLLTKRRK